MQKRNVLHSPRLSELKKRRRKAVLNKFLFIIFGFSIVLVALAYFTRLDKFNIKEVEVAGNKIIDGESIKEIVNAELAGYYFKIFPKTNFILYPQDKIEAELKNKFKRIKDISVNDRDRKVLEIALSERKALYTWCGGLSQQETPKDQKCYFLDEEGYIFDEAPYFSDDVYFRFYGLADLPESVMNEEGNPLGFYLTDNFKSLASFKEMLVGMNIKPVSGYIKKDKNVEISLSSGGGDAPGPKVLLKLDSDFQNVAENLEAALTTEPLKSEFKNKYKSLLYIDLRFGNKVYYKFQ